MGLKQADVCSYLFVPKYISQFLSPFLKMYIWPSLKKNYNIF